VTLAHVLYHPEAIALVARAADALTPLLEAVQAATRAATHREGFDAHRPWTPHVTVAYSSAVQPAAPVIAALGPELPPCEIAIHSISLVNQDGPEYLWNWYPIAEVHLGTA
jgi:2'-5' RNA ligase